MATVKADTLRSLAFGGISGTYATVGTPLTQNWRMFRAVNNTNGDLFLSLDGVNNQFFVPAGSFVLYDCATNGFPSNQTENFVFGKGTQWYCKQSTAPSSGTLYIEGIYA